jgi:hypothetical protein
MAAADGALAILSIRRILAPLPGPWSAPGRLPAPAAPSDPGPVFPSVPPVPAPPGTAPTANTEGVVNTHRGIAL